MTDFEELELKIILTEHTKHDETSEYLPWEGALEAMKAYAKVYHEKKQKNKIRFRSLDSVTITFNSKDSKRYVVIGDPLGLGTIQLKAETIGDDLPYDITIRSNELNKERFNELLLRFSGVRIKNDNDE